MKLRIEDDQNWADVARVNSPKFQRILNKSIVVTLDSVSIDNIHWRVNDHSLTEQEGLHSKIDVSHLEKGFHDLQFKFVEQTSELRRNTFTNSILETVMIDWGRFDKFSKFVKSCTSRQNPENIF